MGEAPNRLKELREAAGLTQAEVAARVGSAVTAGAVSRWERGEVRPQLPYRRRLAALFGVSVDQLGIAPAPAPTTSRVEEDDYVIDDVDPRVQDSQQQWRQTRQTLNANRHRLSHVAAGLYPGSPLAGTGLIADPSWIPSGPVDLADVTLAEVSGPPPTLSGSEPESAIVRPLRSLTEPYRRYTSAIRDLAPPRLFEDRPCFRLGSVDWSEGAGKLGFGSTSYMAGVDVHEVVAHELAYVAVSEGGVRRPALRELPYRRLVGDPFDLGRRPVLPAISTLTIRAGKDGAEFLLHRRDPRRVTAAGGMLQVIPSGIFQPSSVLPDARQADFDLWRNVQREFSEELLGLPECDGHSRVDYRAEPFATLDAARADGRLRVYALGVALDALTLFGEILTVAVVEAGTFDALAADFVDRNDEGAVVAERMPFTEDAIRDLLDGGRLAPAGAGCVSLAWQWRDRLLPPG